MSTIWTEKHLASVKELLDNEASVRDIADLFETSTAAVRGVINRHGLRATAATPKGDALDGYLGKVKTLVEQTRVKSMERDLYTLRNAADAFSTLTSTPLPAIKRLQRTPGGKREATSVGMLSDVHVEEKVRKGETPVGNEYNPAIAEDAIARFFSGYLWLVEMYRQEFDIRQGVIWLGGDLMTGHIHDELKESTETTPIETLLLLRTFIVAGIDMLLEEGGFDSIHLPCSYGNHGRNTVKPYRAKGAAHSYEWLLYQWLAEHYKDEPRVKFLADQAAHQYLEVYDFDLHFHHGDEANYQGGVGGITIPINKAVAQWDVARRCDYHHFGHFHQYIDTGRVVVNGSCIGFNAYAMSIKAMPEPPRQAFYLLDAKRGKTCSSPIWVRK